MKKNPSKFIDEEESDNVNITEELQVSLAQENVEEKRVEDLDVTLGSKESYVKEGAPGSPYVKWGDRVDIEADIALEEGGISYENAEGHNIMDLGEHASPKSVEKEVHKDGYNNHDEIEADVEENINVEVDTSILIVFSPQKTPCASFQHVIEEDEAKEAEDSFDEVERVGDKARCIDSNVHYAYLCTCHFIKEEFFNEEFT
ncbi:hypothetical protein K7X08_025733 [Anisodus acutangulus]|uniref:Uncharacterized protein n=1 Tax=Anisodus acutangulus TaxID=402998 RepID=A0A9Q1L813_9SOLA|nr:hypothetical protein K7X08_025733 [Anisodus acutangulus]